MKKKKEEESKNQKNIKNIIPIVIILVIVVLTIVIVKLIVNNSKITHKEENNYQAKYYGNYYGEKIKQISLMYYLENNKMISSNELIKEIKNVEDYKFDNSEVYFSDIKCKSIYVDDTGILKLIDCTSEEFNSKKGYTYEANILDVVNNLKYSDINASFTEKSMQGLAKIYNFNLNVKYSIGCNQEEKNDTLRQVDYNSIKYVKVKRDGKKANSETISENDNVEIQVCKRINLDNIDKKIDISSINLNNKLRENDFTPIKLKEVAETIGETVYELDYRYKYENNIFYLKDKNGFTKEYNNVKKVYYNKVGGCTFNIEFFVFTEEKIYDIDIDNSRQFLNEKESSIYEKQVYQNNSYDSIYSILARSLTCGAEYKYIASKDDKLFYNLSTGEQLDMSIKYNDYDILTTDRKFNDYNTKLDTKLIMKDTVVSKIHYIIDSNDYLYGYIYDEENTSFKKLSDKKVKTIYYNEENKYSYIQFIDDTFYNDNVINAVSIEY